jgi:hypothetical protein
MRGEREFGPMAALKNVSTLLYIQIIEFRLTPIATALIDQSQTLAFHASINGLDLVCCNVSLTSCHFRFEPGQRPVTYIE